MTDSERTMTEEVNHPDRYGGDTTYECIKVLEAWMPREQYKGFLRGNVLNWRIKKTMVFFMTVNFYVFN